MKGSWIEPEPTCPVRGSTFASFWVGIGGAGAASTGLEQIGTETDCARGLVRHSVWYELIPAGPVAIPLTVSGGDTLSAEVAISGQNVTLSITDATTGATYSKTVTLAANLDTTSAEWIAEAPSTCTAKRCSPLPLANFGTLAFTAASAVANGHLGTIADATWSATQILLHGVPTGSRPRRARSARTGRASRSRRARPRRCS